MNIDRMILGWRFTLYWCMDQPSDHYDTWLGIGGFKYKGRTGRGCYLFLYYGVKMVHINLEKSIKVMDKSSDKIV